jgi:hypothetical protein
MGEARLSALLFRRRSSHPVSSFTCEATRDRAGVVRVETADFSDLIVLSIGERDGVRMSSADVSFDGQVLWARETTGGALTVRSLATRTISLHKRGVELRAAADPEDFDYSKAL